MPENNRSNEENNMKIIATAVLILMTLVDLTQAEPRKRHESKRHESHNYIIERQQAGQVSGVPILRRIRGSREIDIYRDGSMYEKNNFVGYDKR
jgi:hypothetical protein